MSDDNPAKADSGLTDTHLGWIKEFTGIDPQDVVKTAVMAAAPLPLPTPPPEGPVSGVFEKVVEGVEEGAEVVGEGALTVGAGALAVGAAVAGAILTWASPTAPPWMDEMNPETGQPYASEQEYKEVQKRLKEKPAGPGGGCDGKLKGIFDQLKHLEGLYEEASEDRDGLWAKENAPVKFKGRINPNNQTTWTGHIDQFDREKTNLKTRIEEWERECSGMPLDEAQQEELEMAREWVTKDFPDRPVYAN